MTVEHSSFIDAARATLRQNDRGGYTVPTARLYPYQWNWDSAFAALGFSTFDEPRAWQEVQSLLKGQWDDGMLPHIVFHQSSPDYFPGPGLWGVRHDPPTSGITQPPVLASAVRLMLERSRDRRLAEERVASFFPQLVKWHSWWERARDPEGFGLSAIIHPWESGMDNSPSWDVPLERVPATTRNIYQRRDTCFVDESQRPRQADYDRYMHLVEVYRDVDWEPGSIWKVAPFKVLDVGVNAILHRADADLAAMSERFGKSTDNAAIATRMERRASAFKRLWSSSRNLYQPFDLIAGQQLDVVASSGFIPLYAGIHCQTSAIIMELRRWMQDLAFGVPTVPASAISFDRRRYWRGPIWAVVNWLIADGLGRAGEHELANRVAQDTLRLIREHGFCEYFDPIDGTGLGGNAFTWTAAVFLVMASERPTLGLFQTKGSNPLSNNV